MHFSTCTLVSNHLWNGFEAGWTKIERTYIRTYVHMTVVTKVVDAISMKVHFQFNRCTHDKTDY